MYFSTDLNYNQIFVFMYTLFGGLLLGMVYSLNGRIKKYIKSKVYKGLIDISFCVFFFLVMAYILYSVNRGIIKGYTVFGFGVGYYMGFFIFNGFIIKIVDFLAKKCKILKKYFTKLKK